MRAVDGILYCTEHGGISTEGTDYHPDGLGCEYAERESVERCVLVTMYVRHTVPSGANPKADADGAPQRAVRTEP